MKKIIGFLGVAVFAIAMFFNTNVIESSNSTLNLANLVSLNPAEATCEPGAQNGKCDWTGQNCYVAWTYTDCQLGL